MNAAGWHALGAVHMSIHRKQIERIPLGPRRSGVRLSLFGEPNILRLLVNLGALLYEFLALFFHALLEGFVFGESLLDGVTAHVF